ncbi:MAG: multicopper oxidase family protein [Thermomicrobiales bacterium]
MPSTPESDSSSSLLPRKSLDRRRLLVGAAATGLGGVSLIPLLGNGVFAQATPEASSEASPEAAHSGMAMASPEAPTGLGDLPAMDFVAGEPLREVPTIVSQDGVLEVTLNAGVRETTVGGKTVTTANFNGEFPGPTWVANPGDTIRVHFENSLDEFTNLHTHGFHVSPLDNGDNVFIEIDPGTTFDYEYQLPITHPDGVYWYHPHPHGITEKQNTSGMVGTILLGGGLDKVPGIEGLTRQHLFLQLNQFAENGMQVPIAEQTAAKQVRLVNGQYQPVISIKPGETQRWSVSNASSNDFFLISLGGHTLYQIAKDGNAFAEIHPQDQILLAPAERVEFLVQATTTPGSWELRTLPWGLTDQAEPDVLLATMEIAGDVVPVQPLPTQLIPFADLRDMPIDNERIIVFSPAPAPWYQLINDTLFDPNVVNETVTLGALEKWTIQNTTTDAHPFHIHINDFQLISVNGEPVDAPGLYDTVIVPALGEIQILHRFLDFTGKYVFHCHILMHEDAGMMAVVEVVP